MGLSRIRNCNNKKKDGYKTNIRCLLGAICNIQHVRLWEKHFAGDNIHHSRSLPHSTVLKETMDRNPSLVEHFQNTVMFSKSKVLVE